MVGWIHRHKVDLAISVGTFVLGIFFLTIIGIWIHPPIDEKWVHPNTQFDSELGWSPIPAHSVKTPDGKTFSSNEFGFRSPPLDAQKPSVFLVGDSVAFGYGVSDENSLSYLMNARYPALQTFNLSVPGYGVDQYYLSLQKYLVQLKPTHVFLIIYSGNDLKNTITNTSYGRSKPLFHLKDGELTMDGVPIAKDSCTNFLTTSLLWRGLGKFSFLKSILDLADYFRERLCGVKTLPLDEGKQLTKFLLKRTRDLAEENGAKFYFVLSVPKKDIAIPSEDTLFFRDVFERNNIPFLDYAKTLEADANVDNLYYDFAHYSAAGNERLSNYLVSQLERDNDK